MVKKSTWLVFTCIITALSTATNQQKQGAATAKTPDPAKVKEEFTRLAEEEAFLGVLMTKECCACTECVEAEAVLSAIVPKLEDELGIRAIKIFNQPEIESFYGIKTWPSLIFLRKKKPALFDGPFDPEVLYQWIKDNREVSTKFIGDGTFEHVTQAATGATTGDWLVIFTNSTCTHGMSLLPHVEKTAIQLKHRINVAYVDTEKNIILKDRFSITKCPTVLFFRQGQMYEYKLHKYDSQSLQDFAKRLYKQVTPQKVPEPSSPLKMLLDSFNGKFVPIMYITITILVVYLWAVFVHRQVERKTELKEE